MNSINSKIDHRGSKKIVGAYWGLTELIGLKTFIVLKNAQAKHRTVTFVGFATPLFVCALCMLKSDKNNYKDYVRHQPPIV